MTMLTDCGLFTGDGTPVAHALASGQPRYGRAAQRRTGEPAHWAQADIQVQLLAQRDVQAADAAAHRRGERAFDADELLAEGVLRGTQAA